VMCVIRKGFRLRVFGAQRTLKRIFQAAAMKFKDLTVGMVIHHPPVRVDQDEMLAFARAYDPQWFHVDAERAKTSRWGGLIASGWMTCGLAMRMATESVLDGSESFGSPGLERLRWIAPVRAGD